MEEVAYGESDIRCDIRQSSSADCASVLARQSGLLSNAARKRAALDANDDVVVFHVANCGFGDRYSNGRTDASGLIDGCAVRRWNGDIVGVHSKFRLFRPHGFRDGGTFDLWMPRRDPGAIRSTRDDHVPSATGRPGRGHASYSCVYAV